MPISANRQQDEIYVPEEDVTETLEDGRTIQVAVKGVAIPMPQALLLGLVKAEKKQGPTETKPRNSGTERK